MPPPYRAQFLVSIERTVTKERLTRYLGATKQDVYRALELYEYNVQLSEILYGLLHGLEVTVRNAEHHALTASYGTPTWYDVAPLSAYWKDQIANAKQKLSAAAAPGYAKFSRAPPICRRLPPSHEKNCATTPRPNGPSSFTRWSPAASTR